MLDGQNATTKRARAATGRRTLDRVRSFCRARLSPCQIVNEQLRVVGEALRTHAVPAFYVLDTAQTPHHEFNAWLGDETLTDEIRLLLAANFWPAPPEVPSPGQLIAKGDVARFVAVTLWGGPTPTPWEDLWRQRDVRHGLYGAFFSAKGRIGIMLSSRGGDDPPFDDLDLAFARACAPYIEAAMDMPVPAPGGTKTPLDAVQLRFDGGGALWAMSFGGPELLRDLGGGGPGAATVGRERIQQATCSGRNGALPGGAQEWRIRSSDVAEEPFKKSMFNLGMLPPKDPERTGAVIDLGENAFGHFQLRLTTLVGRDGSLERLGILTRLVPLLLLQLRGALAVQASGREIQLLCAIADQDSLKDAAATLNISKATARTLGERLAARVGASGLSQAVHRLAEIGRAV